jgi:hypothetical protein
MKINFTQAGAGSLVDEGDYVVTLNSLTEKKTRDGKKDMLTFTATIVSTADDDDTPMKGRKVFRNFVFDPADGADNSASTYYLQQTLLAFGADEDLVVSDDVDPVKEIVMCEDGIKGSQAKATVVHKPRNDDPDKMQADVRFSPLD